MKKVVMALGGSVIVALVLIVALVGFLAIERLTKPKPASATAALRQGVYLCEDGYLETLFKEPRFRSSKEDVVLPLPENLGGPLIAWLKKTFLGASGVRFSSPLSVVVRIESPKEGYSADARMSYYFMKKAKDGSYCLNNSVNGTTPFNDEIRAILLHSAH